MLILVKPVGKKKSSESCHYTCPVYKMGLPGLKKANKIIEKELGVSKGKKGKKKKSRDRARFCWYGN